MPADSDLFSDDDLQESPTLQQSSLKGATEGGESALIPKSLLMGKDFNPGDEVVLKIVHVYEDEVEVQYATGKESEEGESEESGMSDMGKAESDMEGMAKPMEEVGGY